MNRFFDKKEYRREFPRRAFVRLDDIEQTSPVAEDGVTFIFDAVDADWEGFGEGGPFNLADPGLEERIARYWGNLFNGGDEGDEGVLNGYNSMPIYQIELSLSAGDRFFDVFPRGEAEEPWMLFTLSETETGSPVDIYGGLFGEPSRAHLGEVSTSTPSGPLNILFNMNVWPDADQDQLLRALRRPCPLEMLVCFDVGQGSASALVCKCGCPVYYFDTGCGSKRNASTAPAQIDFCSQSDPIVILSHWDIDHWAGAQRCPDFLTLTWVVPRQHIGITATAFANDILNTGGRILVVANGAPPLRWSGAKQSYDLQRATGIDMNRAKDRNGGGLVLIVTDNDTQRSWVLTGDAGYDLIAQNPPTDIAAMVVPHHGADMGQNSVPFPRSRLSDYSRLIYSFGPGNAHGKSSSPVRHPVNAAIAAHQAQGWDHGSWTTAGPGQALARGDVLATASHPSTHEGGIAVGWSGPPGYLRHLSCFHLMPVTQS